MGRGGGSVSRQPYRMGRKEISFVESKIQKWPFHVFKDIEFIFESLKIFSGTYRSFHSHVFKCSDFRGCDFSKTHNFPNSFGILLKWLWEMLVAPESRIVALGGPRNFHQPSKSYK